MYCRFLDSLRAPNRSDESTDYLRSSSLSSDHVDNLTAGAHKFVKDRGVIARNYAIDITTENAIIERLSEKQPPISDRAEVVRTAQQIVHLLASAGHLDLGSWLSIDTSIREVLQTQPNDQTQALAGVSFEVAVAKEQAIRLDEAVGAARELGAS